MVAAVDDDRVVATDAPLGHEFAEAFAVDQVARVLLLQLGPPVEGDGARDVAVGVVRRHVLVDLEDLEIIGQARGGPAGADQYVVMTHAAESSGRGAPRPSSGAPPRAATPAAVMVPPVA